MGAVNYGHPTVVLLLLSQGADPDFTYPDTNETMLHFAALRGMLEGSTECVRLLLNAGADPNVHCKAGIVTPALDFGTKVIGETPLHRAAAFGSEAMIQLFVEAGADVRATDAHGETPLNLYGRFQRRRPHLRLENGAGKYLEVRANEDQGFQSTRHRR
ncbi:MAG: ankyrin repeat domain-containing protein [Verrucomicrobiota bacterium]